MGYFAMHDMPLRGAIGFGDYVVEQKNDLTRLFLSTAFEDLSRAEKDQEWTGCYVLPNSEAVIQEHLFGAPDCGHVSQSAALYRYSVPLKRGERVNAWCLNWLHGMTDEACAAYATVVSRWGNAKPRSITGEKAKERIRALACGK